MDGQTLTSTSSSHVLAALGAVAAGGDPGPALTAYLHGLRDAHGVDEAGLLTLGADGHARTRAWVGARAAEAAALEAQWVVDGRVDALALAGLELARIAVWPAGREAVVVLGRHDDGPLPAAAGDPLLSAVALAEQAAASRRALAVAAAACAAPDEVSLRLGVDAALARGFGEGAPVSVPLPGGGGRLTAAAGSPADREALAAVAALVAVSLGRTSQLAA